MSVQSMMNAEKARKKNLLLDYVKNPQGGNAASIGSANRQLSALQSYETNNLGTTSPLYSSSYGNTGAYAGNASGGGGYGSSTGASGSMTTQDLINEYKKAQDEAKAVNEARYAEGVAGYDKRYGDVMSGLEGMGDQTRKDIYETGEQQKAVGTQSMVSRGLTGTTVMPTMKMGYDRETASNVGRLDESLRQQKLGYTEGLQKDKLDYMERREDTGPDMAAYTNLLSNLGQAEGMSNIGAGLAAGGGGGGYGSDLPRAAYAARSKAELDAAGYTKPQQNISSKTNNFLSAASMYKRNRATNRADLARQKQIDDRQSSIKSKFTGTPELSPAAYEKRYPYGIGGGDYR